MMELPYTVSSMKNNHLLGDGLGPRRDSAACFPSHPRPRGGSGSATALFLKQLARHMHADGSMIEDSLSYHRFVLEMLSSVCSWETGQYHGIRRRWCGRGI